ncbi:MAG: NAD-dependent epimerase/dehydratase family protein, partial [Candidatus Aminicenantes bacterium]|nr:NAD-dependent epimerase/dehydratase family protein [Candidatus Aminicenantes bacterium]
LRIFSAYGPRQRPDLAIHKFMKLMMSGETLKLFSDSNKVRDYVYSGDIARGVAKCLEYISGFEIMNIGSGKGISLREVIKAIETTTGVDAKIKYIESPPGYIDSGIADISRAEELIGYMPEVEFSTGVVKFCEWFKKIQGIVNVQK